MTLTTPIQNVTLKVAEKDDAKEFYELVQANADHLNQHEDYQSLILRSLAETEEEFEAAKPANTLFLILFQKRIVGAITLIQHEKRKLGLSYWLSKEQLKKGYMTEGLRSVIKYAVKKQKAKEIWADIRQDNYPSQKLIQNLGFILAQEQDSYLRYILRV